MSERQVCIIGGGMSLWGRRSASLVDVVQEAAKACFDDIPGIKRKDVDGFLFASSYCGRNPFQVNAAPGNGGAHRHQTAEHVQQG
jgi:acetyl-CoA C-acetyltransferase